MDPTYNTLSQTASPENGDLDNIVQGSPPSPQLVETHTSEGPLVPDFQDECMAKVRLSHSARSLLGDSTNFRTLKHRAGGDLPIYVQPPQAEDLSELQLIDTNALKDKAPNQAALVEKALNVPKPQDAFSTKGNHVIVFLTRRVRMLIGKEERLVFALWIKKASSAATFIDLEASDEEIRDLARGSG